MNGYLMSVYIVHIHVENITLGTDYGRGCITGHTPYQLKIMVSYTLNIQ